MTTDSDRLKQQLAALPVFPLPTATLLPQELLPLHIFEPRYREMLRDVVADDRLLAIARLSPGWEGDYDGRPPMEPVAGVGEVVRHERMPDGRSNILLRGIARIRLVEELPPDRPYREARAEILEDVLPPEGASALAGSVDRVRTLLFQLCSLQPGPASNALAARVARAQSAADVADIVCAALITTVNERAQAQETLEVASRLKMAKRSLSTTIASVDASRRTGPRN